MEVIQNEQHGLSDEERRRIRKIREGQQRARTVGRLVTVAVLAVVVAAGYFAYTWFAHDSYLNLGMVDFKEAYMIEKYGSGKLNSSSDVTDPAELYVRALTAFQQAAANDDSDFMAHFMIVKSAQAIINRASDPKSRITPGNEKRARAAMNKSSTRLKQLDPSGRLMAERQKYLNDYLLRK